MTAALMLAAPGRMCGCARVPDPRGQACAGGGIAADSTTAPFTQFYALLLLLQDWVEAQKEFAGLERSKRNVWVQVRGRSAGCRGQHKSGGSELGAVVRAHQHSACCGSCSCTLSRCCLIAHALLCGCINAHARLRAAHRTHAGAAGRHGAQQRQRHAALAAIPGRPPDAGQRAHADDRRHRPVCVRLLGVCRRERGRVLL